jgi:excisionase family DNA binding protein
MRQTATTDSKSGQFLTEQELARRWNVSPRTIQRLVRDGELSPVTIRRSPRFALSTVEAYEHRPDTAGMFEPKFSSSELITRSRGVKHQVGRDCFRVAVAHLKGGQAKTTTVLFTAWELSDLGYHVVCRDLDIDNPNLTDAFRDVGAMFDETSVGHLSDRMALVPDGTPIPFRAEFELIDTPPAKDGSMQGAARADGVVIPAEPELPAGRSLDKMLASIAALRTRNRDLRYLGVLPTRVRKRLSDHQRFIEMMGDIAAEYDFPLLEPIPDSRWVRRYSNREHLWRSLADRLVTAKQAVING